MILRNNEIKSNLECSSYGKVENNLSVMKFKRREQQFLIKLDIDL